MRVDRVIQEYINERGKTYRPAICPDYIMRGEVGDCFDVCMLNAARFPHLRYVEGIAAHPFKENVWIHHAWLTDGEAAYDPTWGLQYAGRMTALPVLTLYHGIEMDTAKMIAFMRATEYKAVMANGWRNRDLADALIPHFPYAISGISSKM